MVITDATISTDVWDAIRTVLVHKITVDSSSVSIRAAYSDKHANTPQIVIYPINIQEESYKFDGKYGKRFINVTVEIYSLRSDHLDDIKDQIVEEIKDSLVDGTLSGMDLIGIQEDYTFGEFNNQKVHIKNIVFSFDRE